jgi:hypothetical protein
MFLPLLLAYFGLMFLYVSLKTMYMLGYRDGDKNARLSQIIEITKRPKRDLDNVTTNV